MTHLIDKDAVRQAKETALNTFNLLPFETRKKVANGYDRLLEVELLLGKGDNIKLLVIFKKY